MNLYIHPHVQAVRDLLDVAVSDPGYAGLTLERQIEEQAIAVAAGHRERHPGVYVLAKNRMPELAELSQEDLFARNLSSDEALEIVARDHGFSSWGEVLFVGGVEVDPEFEQAVDAVVNGWDHVLANLLETRHTLASERSRMGHSASLLHYVAANGVEIRRQTVPENAFEIAIFLLGHGADPNATARLYGGEYSVLAMLRSSGHPQAAGVGAALEDLFVSAGGV